MARETSKQLRNKVMYSVFVRNHTAEGTFRALCGDLDRIQSLGVDIIWLMPIHPIGKVARKGVLGSPYAISDYRAINPEFGTMDDFKKLVDEIHSRGMKCIIDVVYNHTSPDSTLVREHPEWFYRKPDGKFGNKVGEWLDVIDLDYNKSELWDYQIETLKMWAGIVDGFRCDVAPLIPLEFWLRARAEVAKVRPDCLWLSESVEPVFTIDNRARGMVSLSDSEIFQAFDLCYEYDIYSWFVGYLTGVNSLQEYVDRINMQEAIYPDNYVKLRFLENHDNARAHFLVGDEDKLSNWLAFCYFQKGMTLLYGGQEVGEKHLPSLFDRDTVDWEQKVENINLSAMMSSLYQIKQNPLFTDSRYTVKAMPGDVILASHTKGGKGMMGIFNVGGEAALTLVPLAEGIYRNLIDGSEVEVHRGRIYADKKPIIVEFTEG